MVKDSGPTCNTLSTCSVQSCEYFWGLGWIVCWYTGVLNVQGCIYVCMCVLDLNNGTYTAVCCVCVCVHAHIREKESLSLLVHTQFTQIDQATTEEALDQILQDPAKMAIVNSSRWPVTKSINLCTKSELVQAIMEEELLSKRGDNIRAFQKGLSVMGFMTLCLNNPDVTKSLFVYEDRPLTASVFLQPPVMSKLITKPDQSKVNQVNAFNWFVKYINERSSNGR